MTTDKKLYSGIRLLVKKLAMYSEKGVLSFTCELCRGMCFDC